MGHRGWPLDGSQVYDELEGGLLFREQKDTGDEPSLGIKRVLRSARVWVVVTARSVYRSGPSTLVPLPIYHPSLSSRFSRFYYFSFLLFSFLPCLCRASSRSRLSPSLSLSFSPSLAPARPLPRRTRKDQRMFREVLCTRLCIFSL